MEKYYYTWQNLLKDAVKLARKLNGQKFDYIVAITRGGLIPAALLAYHLKIRKVKVIGFSHYRTDAVRKKITLISPLSSEIKKSKVLLVDDVIDSGETMKKAYQILAKRKNRVTIAVLHYKSQHYPIIKPDYFVSDPGKVWVVYPWEI